LKQLKQVMPSIKYYFKPMLMEKIFKPYANWRVKKIFLFSLYFLTACVLKALGLDSAEALTRVGDAGSNPQNAEQSGLVDWF